MRRNILLLIIILASSFVVNAQDLTVTIDGTVGECRKTTSKNVPVWCANKWAISQQFYTAEEICKASGIIESIAFKTAEVTDEKGKYPFTRNLIIYITNTEEYAVAGNSMKAMSTTNQVFSGEVEFSYNTWVSIDIEDFEYTGKNILICINDVTGSNVTGGVTFEAFIGASMIGEDNGYRALYKRSISGPFDATTTITGASTILDTPVPLVQLTFKEGSTEEYPEPAQPSNFTATVLSESEVLLEWDKDENTSTYDIYQDYAVIANVTDTSYIAKDLTLGWHCFKIVGVNGIKESAPSELQCVELVELPEDPEDPETPEIPEEPETPEIPAAPIVTAEATSDTTVVLTWTAIDSAASYNIYKDSLQLANITDTTYAVTGLTAETTYSFFVTALNDTLESIASNIVEVTTLAAEEGDDNEPENPEEDDDESEKPTAPAAPVVTAEATSDTTVVLTWTAIDSAASYNIYMDSLLLANITDTTYAVTGLTAETTYSFFVTALNDTLESIASNIVEVTTLAAEEGGDNDPEDPDPENPGESISEISSSLLLYPNPVNDKLYIETEVEIEEVVVYDIYGRLQDTETPSHQDGLSIDVSGLNSGVYFVKIATENGTFVKRIVKN